MAIQDDEGGQATGALLPFDADFGGGGAFEVGEGLGPEFVVGVGVADDGVGAVGVGGRLGVGGGAEGDGGEVAVGFLRVGLSAEEGEPVDGAAFVRVEAQAGEIGDVLSALSVVEGAEEVVFAVVHPGRRNGEVVADQGGEFEVLVAGPLADLLDFGAGEEAIIGVAADEVGLLADCETMVANL